jgi:hypothetical protein
MVMYEKDAFERLSRPCTESFDKSEHTDQSLDGGGFFLKNNMALISFGFLLCNLNYSRVRAFFQYAWSEGYCNPATSF